MDSTDEFDQEFSEIFFCGLFSIKTKFLESYEGLKDIYDKHRFLSALAELSVKDGVLSSQRFTSLYLDDLLHRYKHGKSKKNPFENLMCDWNPASPENVIQKELGDEIYKYYQNEADNVSYASIEQSIIYDNLKEFEEVIFSIVPSYLERIENRINRENRSFEFIGSNLQKAKLFELLKNFNYQGVEYRFISDSTVWECFETILGNGKSVWIKNCHILWVVKSKSHSTNLVSLHDLFNLLVEAKLLEEDQLLTSNGYLDKVATFFKVLNRDNQITSIDKPSLKKNNHGLNQPSFYSHQFEIIKELVNQIKG